MLPPHFRLQLNVCCTPTNVLLHASENSSNFLGVKCTYRRTRVGAENPSTVSNGSLVADAQHIQTYSFYASLQRLYEY